jgi:hypothetical protein
VLLCAGLALIACASVAAIAAGRARPTSRCARWTAQPAPAGAARPRRDGELLGHLVRPVPPGDAAPEPAVREVPRSGFVLLGVNVDDDRAMRPSSPTKLGVTFPVLLDTDKRVSKLYDLDTMPSTVLIDRDGKVRYLHRGYLDGYEDTYDKQIRELLKE